MIGCLTLNLKRGETVTHQEKDQLVCNYGNKHVGEYLVGTNNGYSCDKSFHMVKDCPNVKIQGKKNIQDYSSIPSSKAPKRNHFCALKSTGEQESSPIVVTSMLQVFFLVIFMLCLIQVLPFILLHLW